MNVRIMTLVLIAVVSICAACQSNSSVVPHNGTLSENSLPALRNAKISGVEYGRLVDLVARFLRYGVKEFKIFGMPLP